MKGLVSSTPSQQSVRLALSGFLLLLVQSMLLMMAPGLDSSGRTLVWVLTPVATMTLILSLIGLPDPAPDHWRRRHVR